MLGISEEINAIPATLDKAANIAFILEDIEGWFNYCNKNKPFEIRSKEMEVGDEGKYKAFIGYDPENYYLEFDAFYKHKLNDELIKELNK